MKPMTAAASRGPDAHPWLNYVEGRGLTSPRAVAGAGPKTAGSGESRR
jgi:hypothetical protein